MPHKTDVENQGKQTSRKYTSEFTYSQTYREGQIPALTYNSEAFDSSREKSLISPNQLESFEKNGRRRLEFAQQMMISKAPLKFSLSPSPTRHRSERLAK